MLTIDILNLSDPGYPKNIQTGGEPSTFNLGLSEVVFKPFASLGEPIEFKVVLKSDTFLLVPAEASDLSISINDVNWRRTCIQQFIEGLYPGSFFG